MLTDAEKRRYRRHIILDGIGEEGQIKLKKSKVLVVGAGGLGAPVLQYLSAAGVGTIAIMDDDTVNEDNLHRQVLYGGKDLGKLKTIIARDRLQILNPLINYEVLNIRLKEGNALDIISRYDLVIDATDNFSTRYLINDACLILEKPWIYGGVYKFEGQMAVFNYKGGPTLNCLYESYKDRENIPDPTESGLFGILPGIIGSFQANEAIKILTESGEILSGKLLHYNMLTNESRILEIPVILKNREIRSLKEQY